MIIACEGIDAAGKATQAPLIVDALRARGLTSSLMSFPNYKTETGLLLKKLLKGERRLGACEEFVSVEGLHHDQALVLQALMTANRYEAISVLRSWKLATPSSPNGSAFTGVLVLDRYWSSGYAYGSADGIDPNWLLNLHLALPQPDLTIFCDITVEQSFQRRPVREDAYEASRERLEKARQAYWKLVELFPNEWFVTDANGTVESIHAQIMGRVDQLLAASQNYPRFIDRQGC